MVVTLRRRAGCQFMRFHLAHFLAKVLLLLVPHRLHGLLQICNKKFGRAPAIIMWYKPCRFVMPKKPVKVCINVTLSPVRYEKVRDAHLLKDVSFHSYLELASL